MLLKRFTGSLLLLSLLVIVLGGCIAPAPAVETNAPVATEASAEATTEVSAETPTCEEGYRFFEHEWLGTEPQCIPINPQRVVFIPFASYLYPFGIKPIGAGYLERDARNVPVIADWILSDIAEVDYSVPNLEQVAAMQPDLIVHDSGRIDDYVEQLQQIAPVVLFGVDYSSPTLKEERMRFTAALFGQEEKGEELLAAYDARVAEFKSALEAELGDLSQFTVSMIRARDADTFDVYNRNRSQAIILDKVGFARPESIDYTHEEMAEIYGDAFNASGFIRISKERVDLADGDYLIVILSGNGDEGGSAAAFALAEEMKAEPIWNTLNAFQQDQVIFVRDNWLLADNIINAHAILDEFAAYFGVEIPTPNPFLAE